MADAWKSEFDRGVGLLESGNCLDALAVFDALAPNETYGQIVKYSSGVALARLGRIVDAIAILKSIDHAKTPLPVATELLADLEKSLAEAQASTPPQTAPAPAPVQPAPQATPSASAAPSGAATPDYYPVRLGPTTIANYACSDACWEELLSFHPQLITDDYTRYMDALYRDGRKRFGSSWHYLDIVNVLFAAAKLVQPKLYLEIGVRRGRSCSTVVRACPSVNLVLCDMWIQGYGGMENPGERFVQDQLKKHGHTGGVKFLNGNSHEMIPMLMQANPDVRFDMITVDGDHTPEGAEADLLQTLPRIAPGGVAIFDDIVHPVHPELLGVWRKVIAKLGYFRTYEFDEVGYGVAIAVRVR